MPNSAKVLTGHTLVQSAIALLTGAALSLVLVIAHVGLAQSDAEPEAFVATLDPELVKVGTGTIDAALLVVTADSQGAAGLKLPWNRVNAAQYPLLQIRFEKAPDNVQASVAWSTATNTPNDDLVRTGHIDSPEFWLYLAGNSHWKGTIDNFKLVLRGKPRERFSIESISLEPLSARGLLLSNRVDWPPSATWTQRSINFLSVVPNGRGPINPVSAIALLLLSALVVYALWSRATRQIFDLRIAGTVFVLGWIILDGLWLGRLVNQVSATHQQFAGKSIQQKLLDGPDADLYLFISEVKRRLAGEEGSRLFVASSGDYTGMRAAYYLYPHNVYWHRHGPELPDAEDLHAADYIVVFSPSELQIDRVQSALILPDSSLVVVKPVLIRRDGMLLQVR